MKIHLLTLAFLALSVSVTQAEPKVTAINVYPPDINLQTKQDLQHFIVVATRDDGVTLDVTGQSAVKIAAANLVRQDKNTLYPVADGQTTLDAEYQGLKAAATITVKEATAERGISFQLDV